MIAALSVLLSALACAASVTSGSFNGGTVANPTTFESNTTVGQPAGQQLVTSGNFPIFTAPSVYLSSASGATAVMGWKPTPSGPGGRANTFRFILAPAGGFKMSYTMETEDLRGDIWSNIIIDTTQVQTLGLLGINAQQDPGGTFQNGGDAFSEAANDEGQNVGDSGIWDYGVCGVQGGGHGCPANDYFINASPQGTFPIEINPAAPNRSLDLEQNAVDIDTGLVVFGSATINGSLIVNESSPSVSNFSFQMRGTLFIHEPTQNAGVYVSPEVGPYGVIQATNDTNTATNDLILEPYGGSARIGTTGGTQLYRCSGGTDGGWILYGGSGPAQTLCTGAGGSLVALPVYVP